MSLLGLLFGDITPLLVGLRATQYMTVACATLWTHEYFLTLDREVALVWPSPWSFGKIMFFLNRYSPIFDTTLAVITLQGVRNQETCPRISSAVSWFFVSGNLWSETILAMRTWAIWSGNRYMFVFLVIFTVAITIIEFVLISKFLKSVTYINVPPFLVSAIGSTCAPLPKQGDTFPDFLVFMINQAVIATLTLTRAFRQYRLTNNQLLGTMFHDGLLYYIYTLVLAIANLTVAVAAPIQWGLFLELPLRVLSSIFCTRVLLNIRGSYFQPSLTINSNNGGVTSTSLGIQHPRRGTHSHWGSASDPVDGSTTLGSHDEAYFDETDSMYNNEDDVPPIEGRGWTWGGTVGPKPPRLTLRPITPFHMEIVEITQPSP